MTVVDHFSKKIWARALRSKESELVAQFLTEIFKDVGLPQAVLADNGTEFKGAVAKLLADEQVLYLHGKPYAKTTQGCVERANQTVAHAVEACMRQAGYRSWAPFVDQVVAAYNKKVHSTTKATPDDVFYGLCDSHKLSDEQRLVLNECVRLNTIKRANADARRQFASLDTFQPRAVGDLVLVYTPRKISKRGLRTQYAHFGRVSWFSLPVLQLAHLRSRHQRA